MEKCVNCGSRNLYENKNKEVFVMCVNCLFSYKERLARFMGLTYTFRTFEDENEILREDLNVDFSSTLKNLIKETYYKKVKLEVIEDTTYVKLL